MKRRWFVLVSLIGFLFFQGCSSGAVKSEVAPVVNGFTVTYELPNISNFEVVNLTNSIDGINFPSFRKYTGGHGVEGMGQKLLSENSFKFFKYAGDEGLLDGDHISKKSYTISITRESDNGKTIIFSPVKSKSEKASDAIGVGIFSFPVPKLSLSDLKKYLSEGFIIVNGTIEIDSPYNVESTYANFKRLLKSEEYEEGKKDPVTGKIFKDVFYVDLNSTSSPVQVFLEAYPYRNGSKAVVYLSNAKLYAMNDNGVYNFDKIIKELKDKITKVVNN